MKDSVGTDALVLLLRMIRDGVSQNGAPLPSTRQLMRHFKVGLGSLRESVAALEVLGLLQPESGRGTFAVSPELAFKTDALALHFRAAETPEQVDRVLHAWHDLKWQFVLRALVETCRRNVDEDVGYAQEQLSEIYIEAREAVAHLQLAYLEVSRLWLVAARLGHPGILAMASSVAGPIETFEPIWEVVFRAPEVRARAERMRRLVEKRDVVALESELPAMRDEEWEAWKRRLAWSRGHRRPPKFTRDRAGDLLWGGADAPEVPTLGEVSDKPDDDAWAAPEGG